MVTTQESRRVVLNPTKDKTVVYLSHPLSEREYGKHLGMRLTMLGMTVHNPYDVVGVVYDEDRIDIVHSDLDLMGECDLVISFMPVSDNGVMGEICYASQVLKIPVIILTLSHDVWLRFCSDRIVRSEEELIKLIQSQLSVTKRVD